MMRKILNTVGHEPEKVFVDFPESKIFGERIFYQEKISSTMSAGDPIYKQEITYKAFLDLSVSEVYAVSSHNVVGQKLNVTLTGNAVDGVMRYYAEVEKEIDIPEGKRFVDLRYVDEKLEISLQPDLGVASWRLVVERVIYFVIFIVLLIILLMEFLQTKEAKDDLDHKNSLLNEKRDKVFSLEIEMTKLKRESKLKVDSLEDELSNVKSQLAEMKSQKADEGGCGDG
ncbi:MAG: hypothetical protein WC087_01255 [Candidatus Paceibacterota bacterium]